MLVVQIGFRAMILRKWCKIFREDYNPILPITTSDLHRRQLECGAITIPLKAETTFGIKFSGIERKVTYNAPPVTNCRTS